MSIAIKGKGGSWAFFWQDLIIGPAQKPTKVISPVLQHTE